MKRFTELPTTRNPVVLAAAGLVVLLAGFGIAALIAHARVDKGGTTPGLGAQVSGGTVSAIGPLNGTDVAAYVSERRDALRRATGERLAVVSFTQYLTGDQARAAAGRLEVVAMVAAAPGGQPDVVRGSLSDWVDQQKSRAKADRDQTAELLKTVDDPEFKAFYQSEVARLTRLLDGIKPGAPLVFAVVVRGVVPQLQSLASQPGVRLVDVGPSGKASGQAEYHGLRPEEVARVNDTAPRPL